VTFKEDEMKKAIAAAGLCFAASLAYTAAVSMQPLNVKTGLWQMTETITWTGLPPQMASAMKNGQPIKYKSCVKAKDLNSNPWADGSGDKCVWTVLNSNGTDMEVQGARCELGKEYGMTAEVHGKIHVVDSENGTGSFAVTLTGNGQTMNGHASYTGKWIGASCPANMN
jgi:Protein of unknown function (DUF3617)